MADVLARLYDYGKDPQVFVLSSRQRSQSLVVLSLSNPMMTKQLKLFGEIIGSAGLCIAKADQAPTWVGALDDDCMTSDFWNLLNFMEVNKIKKLVDPDFFLFTSHSNQPFFILQAYSEVFAVFSDETSLAIVGIKYRKPDYELEPEISFHILEDKSVLDIANWGGKIAIFDTVLDGVELPLEEEGIFDSSNDVRDNAVKFLPLGNYEVKRISFQDGRLILLTGVVFQMKA